MVWSEIRNKKEKNNSTSLWVKKDDRKKKFMPIAQIRSVNFTKNFQRILVMKICMKKNLLF